MNANPTKECPANGIEIFDRPADTKPNEAFGSMCIFDRTAVNVARVRVSEQADRSFVVYKTAGNRTSRVPYQRRAAAIEYAKKWIEERIALAMAEREEVAA